MAWAAAAIAIGGAIFGGNAAKKAAQTQAASADRAADLTQQQYLQNRADMTPWREAGVSALSQLTAGMQPAGMRSNGMLRIGEQLSGTPPGAGLPQLDRDRLRPGGTWSGGGASPGGSAPPGDSGPIWTGDPLFRPAGYRMPGSALPPGDSGVWLGDRARAVNAQAGSGRVRLGGTQQLEGDRAQLAGTQPGGSQAGDYMRDFTLADFTRDPGYQFRMDEGARGVEASAAARGGALSGGALKALDRYNQGFASTEYGNAYNRFNADRDRRFNRLSAVAGIGQTASRDVAQMGTDAANRRGEYGMQGANARASGYVGMANAANQGVGNYMFNDLMRQRAAPLTTWYNNGAASASRGSTSDSVQLSDGSLFGG